MVRPGCLPTEPLKVLADEGKTDTLGNSTISSSLGGGEVAYHNNGNTQLSRCSTSLKVGRSAANIVASPS